MKVELIRITKDAEKLIELAARTCYDTRHRLYDRVTEKFLRNLMRAGHMSVFEHAWATFDISGISRACSHQLVRHRLATFSQRSQRYVREEGFDYITPPTIAGNAEAASLFHQTVNAVQKAYASLLSLNIPKEDARFILPNACATNLVMTANLREWMHIFKLRLTSHAQWEIRELAARILKILQKEAPIIFGMFKINKDNVLVEPDVAV